MANPLNYFGDKLGLTRTRRESEQNLQAFLVSAADMDSDRCGMYERAESYYSGEHKLRLTARERKFLEASGLPWNENFCETIVDTSVSRLRVSGFGSDNKDFASFARELWSDNRMDAEQDRVHEATVKLGDGFVIVEPAEAEGAKPSICFNPPEHVKVVYDAGEPLYASKVWRTSRPSQSNPQARPIRRLNIFWPGYVEKWFSSTTDGRWEPFLEEAGSTGVAVWTIDGTSVENGGEPIGIPVIHFANKPNPYYGRSELRSVIPQQDALNKSILDFFWVMDAQGWPQQWATGVKPDNIKRHPGSLWTTETAEGQFGQLDPADPSKSIEGIESQIRRMASRSQTALHLMLAGGVLPSGETLKTSESGMVFKTKRRQGVLGNRWEDVVRVAARVETAYGASEPKVDAKLDTRWEQAESRNAVDEANTAVLWQSLGVSEDTILSRLGFDPQEEREKRARDGGGAAEQFLQTAAAMQAPATSEAAGGGAQPAQKPENRVVKP